MQNLFSDKLQKIAKKMGTTEGVTIEDGGSSSEDSMEEDIGGNSKGLMNHDPVKDAAKLIDLELVNLLRYCHTLSTTYKENEEYQEEVMMKAIELGKKQKPKLLIFDMDETLVAAKFAGSVPEKFQSTFSFPYQSTEISVRLRPYLSDALEKLSQFYEMVVFTAGQQDYADNILDYIDPEKKYFQRRLYRQDCIKCDQFYIKDLDIILDREKTEIIIVDNSIVSFAFDLENGVPINSFMGTEEDDKELLFLYSFLEEASKSEDVRTTISESFKLSYLQSTILN